ncbi:MAG TPA: hypothetical protein VGL78_04275 [Solirubrobacteraceae bacterium]|jgi:hypothetical protein
MHDDDTIDAVSTLEYMGTCKEIADAEAGGGGFSIRDIGEMPEHESEFIAAPGLRIAALDDDLEALDDDLEAVAALPQVGCFM